MSVPVLLKVYGNFHPADVALEAALRAALAEDGLLQPAQPDIPVLERSGDMLRISFEGPYFPADDVLDAVRRHGGADLCGKLDIIDLENWRLTRHVVASGAVTTSAAPLNSVLEYSGH